MGAGADRPACDQVGREPDHFAGFGDGFVRMIGRQPEPGPGRPGVGVGRPLGGGGVEHGGRLLESQHPLGINPAGPAATDQKPAILRVEHLEHLAGIEPVDGQRSGQDLRLVLHNRDALADFVSGGRARAKRRPRQREPDEAER